MNEVYRFIGAEEANHPVALLCRILGVPRSCFYAWAEGEEARRACRRADDALAHEIRVVHLTSRSDHGVPGVHAELRRLGHGVNRKRVERLMREHGITGATRRCRRSPTRPDSQVRPAPDLIGRDFTADRPGTRLVGDVTYLPTGEGRLYLACWLDLATREVVGYAMADHHRADLVVDALHVDALHMAHGLGRLEPGCIAHSDRESEHTSNQFRGEIPRLGMRASTGRTGSCSDAPARATTTPPPRASGQSAKPRSAPGPGPMLPGPDGRSPRRPPAELDRPGRAERPRADVLLRRLSPLRPGLVPSPADPYSHQGTADAGGYRLGSGAQ
ncbi:IS3 family transposase [Kitasatospora sp. NA04385]|uniref:IS3 family transposase n=1 Tax=Kitasatospora sp. NA04385 TaxID=2742135 RepID=UPI001592A209|nr:IS3 family transposase [Kitasatospora sp. NA04385]QKW18110.1 IS3 family transposase [Kitasatospora sp. NA04385]